jgi:hypothetical protein
MLSFAVLVLIAGGASAQEGWRDEHGQLIADTDARKSVSGFGGMVLVTSDADWRSKWETPSNAVPHFTEAKGVLRGNRAFVLTFFANPELNGAGNANVTCDIDVVRPDGTSSIHQIDAVCFKGALKGDSHNTYLSAPIIAFVGDPGDPAGEWLVHVTSARHCAFENVLRSSMTVVASLVARRCGGQVLSDRVADHLEQAWRQVPIVKAAVFSSGNGSQVVSRPEEDVEVRHDDPGALVIEAEVLFHGRRQFDALLRPAGTKVRDRSHHRLDGTIGFVNGDDDCAGPGLYALLESGFALMAP